MTAKFFKFMQRGIFCRHYDLVHQYLELGVDVNEKPFLWYAIYEGCEDIARLMVQPQYGMNTSDSTFEAAIVKAIQHNYSTLAWSLLDWLTMLPRTSIFTI